MKTTISPVSCKYGAPMGRHGHTGGEPDKVHLRRVRLDNGGYDSGGAYWGIGATLYEVFDNDGTYTDYFRASSRDAAKAIVRESLPDVKFYR